MRRVTCAALLLLSTAAPASADAVLTLRYGHGGHALAGSLTPVTLRVTNRDPAPLVARFELRPSAGSDVTFAESFVAAGGTRDLVLLFRPHSYGSPLLRATFDRDVRVTIGRQPPTAPLRALDLEAEHQPTAPLGGITVLAVGPRAPLLPEPPQGISVFPLEEDALPDQVLAYDGIDVVYWRNPAEDVPPPAAAVEALLRHVSLGGRLVVSATRRPETLAALTLARFLPAQPGTPAPDSDYRALAVSLLGFRLRGEDGSVPPTGPLVPLLRPAGTPADSSRYRAERRLGMGTVGVLAFDPARFSGARDQLAAAVWLALLGESAANPRERLEGLLSDAGEGHRPHPDPTDILRKLTEDLATGSATPPPIGVLSLFLVLYILAVGPGDYFFLKHLRLLRFSAASFLLLAVLFSALAFFVSFYLFSGPALVNRITLVDVAPDPVAEGSDLVRTEDYAGFYAPRGRTLEFELPGADAAADRLLLPNRYHGSPSVSIPGGRLEVDRRSSASTPVVLAVPFRSLRLLRTVTVRSATLPLSLALRGEGPGRATNGFPFRLCDALIAQGGAARHLVIIPAGSEVAVPPEQTAREWADLPVPSPESLDVRAVARRVLSLSLAGVFPSGPPAPMSRRILERYGLDRSRAAGEDGAIFAAWTDDRDPFDLPGGDGPGFRVTILRKAVEP